MNLSVEAIVILIMAITMLGLGLGFIRSKFVQTGDLFDQVGVKVREDVLADLGSGKKVAFPKTTFTIPAGKSEVGLIGIHNEFQTQQTFHVGIYAAADLDNVYADVQPVKLEYSDEYVISPGDDQLVPLKIEATGAKDKSYLYSLQVTDDNGDNYGNKQFFVKII